MSKIFYVDQGHEQSFLSLIEKKRVLSLEFGRYEYSAAFYILTAGRTKNKMLTVNGGWN
jgi:hypothetical protein